MIPEGVWGPIANRIVGNTIALDSYFLRMVTTIVSSRGSGKTQKAMEWLALDLQNRVMITWSAREATHVRKLFEAAYGVEAALQAQIYDWSSIEHNGRWRLHNKKIIIDNADRLLQKMLEGGTLTLMTTTNWENNG